MLLALPLTSITMICVGSYNCKAQSGTYKMRTWNMTCSCWKSWYLGFRIVGSYLVAALSQSLMITFKRVRQASLAYGMLQCCVRSYQGTQLVISLGLQIS